MYKTYMALFYIKKQKVRGIFLFRQIKRRNQYNKIEEKN